jgi:hypothetical protein
MQGFFSCASSIVRENHVKRIGGRWENPHDIVRANSELKITWRPLLHLGEEKVQRLGPAGSRAILDPSGTEHRSQELLIWVI